MKTIEEKAKAYDKVRKKIAIRFGSNVADEFFAEFEEPEDEKVRKEIIDFLKLPHPQFVGKRDHEKWIAWLENVPVTIDHEKREGFHLGYKACLEEQSEQESEENKGNIEGISSDEAVLDALIRRLEGEDVYVSPHLAVECLKSLKDRVGCEANCTTTKEWSEEDKKIINGLIDSLTRISLNTRTDSTSPNYTFYKEIDWLKSLRPQRYLILSEEEIEKAAQEWDSKANFNPFYMTMENDKPTGVKQSITTHKESFIAGVNWILKSIRPQNKCAYNPYKAVVESIAEMCKHYDKASHSGLRDFYDNVKVKCKDAQEYDKMFPQNTWKPSDEQIKVCKEVYADLLSAKGFDLGTVVSELNRLEEGLKKKGE